MHRKKKIAFYVIISLLSLFIAVVAIEILLRTMAPLYFKAEWTNVNHPGIFRFRNAHGDVVIRVNEYGMRGPDVSISKDENRVRILVIGDSLTWGEAIEFEHTFPEVARRLLGETKYEFLNLSYPGAGVEDYKNYWEQIGVNFSPDIVIIGFFMGNDMFSAQHPYQVLPQSSRFTWDKIITYCKHELGIRVKATTAILWKLFRSDEDPIDIFDVWMGPGRLRILNNPLQEHRLIESGKAEGVEREEVLRRLRLIPSKLRSQAMRYELDPWLMAGAVLHPQSLRESQEMVAGHVLRSWNATTKILDSIVEGIRAVGAVPVIIFAIPRAAQVSEDYAKDFRTLGFVVPVDVSISTSPQDYLDDYAKQRNIFFIDALPDLRKAASQIEERLYFSYDVHASVAGNEVLGQALAKHLRTVLSQLH